MIIQRKPRSRAWTTGVRVEGTGETTGYPRKVKPCAGIEAPDDSRRWVEFVGQKGEAQGNTVSSAWADSDYRHEAAAAGAFFAVTEKKVWAAYGAQMANENILFGEARFEKLGAVGFAQIE